MYTQQVQKSSRLNGTGAQSFMCAVAADNCKATSQSVQRCLLEGAVAPLCIVRGGASTECNPHSKTGVLALLYRFCVCVLHAVGVYRFLGLPDSSLWWLPVCVCMDCPARAAPPVGPRPYYLPDSPISSPWHSGQQMVLLCPPLLDYPCCTRMQQECVGIPSARRCGSTV